MRTILTDLRTLPGALTLDAAATGAMGALLVLGAAPLAAPLGIDAPLLRWAGAVLVPFAALLAWTARHPRAPRAVLRVIVAANALWAAESVLLVATGWFSPTPLGAAFVLAQAAAVALFAWLELRGMRRPGAAVAVTES